MNKYLKLIPLLALSACINVTPTKEDPKDAKTTSETATPKSKIRNNIIIEEHGLKVEQAFLMYEDGSLVSQSNETDVNKKIKCRLIISDGWKQKDGKVFPGAEEIIETSSGDVALDEKDLFKQYDETGVSPEDVTYITLSASITKIDKLYDYFVVKFKVWDKVGKGYVNGSFKFTVK